MSIFFSFLKDYKFLKIPSDTPVLIFSVSQGDDLYVFIIIFHFSLEPKSPVLIHKGTNIYLAGLLWGLNEALYETT